MDSRLCREGIYEEVSASAVKRVLARQLEAAMHEKGFSNAEMARRMRTSRAALGRWLVDAGFAPEEVRLHWRPIGRLLAAAVKTAPAALPDAAGFSRPASWLTDEI